MQFPVWDLTNFAGGFWIALIATVHVYVAHLAVGGGLFLVLTQMFARKEKSAEILAFVKKHTRFFLLLTIVFGAMTGVGIWFTISVLVPQATSVLIRNYVFGWATEWVFFLGEILALLIYYYRFGKMKDRQHLTMGWLYFIFAWLSLFVINGIITFMLTPGQWLATGLFWDGFFNPTFWPSLFFRTFAALMIAGLFGFITAIKIKDAITREKMIRYCLYWVTIPLLLSFVSGIWYLSAMPQGSKDLLASRSSELSGFLDIAIVMLPFIVILGALIVIKLPQKFRLGLAALVVLAGFGYFGSFEFIREAARKPYIIRDYMYSNQILVDDVDRLNSEGFLINHKWSAIDEITDENALQAGQELFKFQCLSCHSIGGMMNDILPLTESQSLTAAEAKLRAHGSINAYMPPFVGTARERLALAQYIVSGLHGKEIQAEEIATIKELPFAIHEWDSETAEYVLLAWNQSGMHCFTDADSRFQLLPPGSTIQAQLIRRGDSPELITEGFTIRYEVQEGHKNPAAHSDYWKYFMATNGKTLKENFGNTGNSSSGQLIFDEELMLYYAGAIPLMPYADDGSYNPYPLLVITAIDDELNKVVAATQTVAPVSTEISCYKCHGGSGLNENGLPGFSNETADAILATHDRLSNTALLAQANAGKPVVCQECHADPAVLMEGKPELLNLSAAMHGFHAPVMTAKDSDACGMCHPSSNQGPTQCLRGYHNSLDLGCIDCHGNLEDVALSLLKGEQLAGKANAEKLMKRISPVMADSVESLNPRVPWTDEPHCFACHIDYADPDVDAFNNWSIGAENLYRNQKDDMDAVACIACHGAPHVIYPAVNPYGEDRDNIQPLQYQGFAGPLGGSSSCLVCHTVMPEDSAHHENMLR
jgi:cytochrome bd-type quinol oxidase subunit 1